ncbi:MAG TPA: type II toxin-antitoxin system VapB family antitoxin [Longimicrobiaceae bacterium]|nr:type II toxin-antitoxin system VapB family antitoxin [Longimicrobiaceae bacterium]
MALNIKNLETDRLAHELAEATGESITTAVTRALAERLAAVRKRQAQTRNRAEVADLQAFVASLPDRDSRTPEEILGYDAHGLPG